MGSEADKIRDHKSRWEGELRELLEDDSDTMNDWEIDFIESLVVQEGRGGWSPSEKQRTTLTKIWNKVFGETG